jgi:hypothetical protein
LVGVVIGATMQYWLSRSAEKQRQQEWLRDNKKQEWRELISTVSRSVRYILDNSFGLMGGEQQKGLVQANSEARSVIEDRIFIAHQVQSENILERWQLFAAEHDFSRMVEYWNHLHDDLVVAAQRDLDNHK